MAMENVSHIPADTRGVRMFRPEDAPEILCMLEAEGITEDESLFLSGSTGVLERDGQILGFFTMTIRHQLPYLQHFCMARRNRPPFAPMKDQYVLIRAARRMALYAGYVQMIFHARGRRTIQFVMAYLRARPYAQKEDGTAFFLVGV